MTEHDSQIWNRCRRECVQVDPGQCQQNQSKSTHSSHDNVSAISKIMEGALHSLARSRQSAIARTRAASHGRPTIWTRIGIPSGETPIGTTAAGFPKRLKHCE